MDYAISEKYKQMSEAVIDAVPELHWILEAGVRIVYERSFKEKKRSGKLVLGECKKVPDDWAFYCPYDFRIIVYEANTEGLTENQLKVLLWHEHLHIGLRETDGELVYRVTPHDIEEFDPIIRRFGPHWANFGADIPDITEGGG